MSRLFSWDTESTYSKDCSITVQGTYGYLRLCDIYLCTIVGDDGFEWAGHPRDCPWDMLFHPDNTVIVHNLVHEEQVRDRLAELYPGKIPEMPKNSFCTLQMANYLGAPGSLAGAVEELLGVKIDKGTRDRMKGKRWEEMTPEFKQEVIRYGLDDSRWALKLWQQHSHKWPQWERELARITRQILHRGVHIDVQRVEDHISHLKWLNWEATNKIPWADQAPALSYKMLCEECRKVGIAPPPSLAMDDEQCAEWEEKWGNQYEWVSAMRQRRRSHTLIKKFETLRDRIRPNGTVAVELKYAYAVTRRWSGSGGCNFQNLGRDDILGTNMRKCIIAPPGKKLIASDLRSIEPICMAVLSGNKAKLDLVRKGIDIYEIHARLTMNYAREESLKALIKKQLETGIAEGEPNYALIRQLAKVRELGLGFMCGWNKFVTFARRALNDEAAFDAIFGADVTDQDQEEFVKYLSKYGVQHLGKFRTLNAQEQRYWINSWKQVCDYRASETHTVALWKKMKNALENSIGSDLTVTLPSGNTLRYQKVQRDPKTKEISAIVCKTGRMVRNKIHPGVLTENLVQASARDVFATGMLKLEEAGYPLVMSTHDEAVVLVDESVDKHEIERLMCIPPDWLPHIPLAAEASEGKVYSK